MYLLSTNIRRQPLSCLRLLTLLLSFSTLATCSQTEILQTTKKYLQTDIYHNDNRTSSESINLIMATETYKTDELFTNVSNKEKDSELQNNISEDEIRKWESILYSGYKTVKCIYSLNSLKSKSALNCADEIMKYVRNVMYAKVPDRKSLNNYSISEEDASVEQNITALEESLMKQLREVKFNVSLQSVLGKAKDTARAGLSWIRSEGKSTFLTGFGLGFLAFALKKLLLPLFIGAQIVKSVMIAMFLPSILGGLGKLVGKGVSTFASASGSSGPSHNNNVDDFEFKDNMADNMDSANAESKYSFQYPTNYGYQNGISAGLPAGTLPAGTLYMPATASGSLNRYEPQGMNSKVSYSTLGGNEQHHYGSYYTRHQQPSKKQDYKVFHNIPSSSLLLTNYDPFYSPLLSRLDSVFKQLGYESEKCRERLVCAMYNNPAKFAPYSNLVSAQLSRELNELRKPSTDNPEILRFFRYMKAAKDGQDGQDCMRIYPGCSAVSNNKSASPPMIKTYHDINKLVQARRLSRSMKRDEHENETLAAQVIKAQDLNSAKESAVPDAEYLLHMPRREQADF